MNNAKGELLPLTEGGFAVAILTGAKDKTALGAPSV